MATTEAELLPMIRQMQAEAELGGTVVNPGYTDAGSSDAYRAGLQQQIAAIQAQLNPPPAASSQGAGSPPTRALGSKESQQLQTQLQSLQAQLAAVPAGGKIYKDSTGKIVPASQAVTDFSGMSQADITGQIQNQEVAGQLATEKQFDPQFIAQALAEEQQSNPQGVAARGDLYADIQKQLQPPVSPVADEMQRQTAEKVAAGSGLTPEEHQKNFAAALASQDLTLVISPDGRDGSIPIHQNVDLYAAKWKGARRPNLSFVAAPNAMAGCRWSRARWWSSRKLFNRVTEPQSLMNRKSF